MIRFATGNVLEADAEALVNTVNCVGVMGRGVALQFKEAFPANFRAYASACRAHEVQPGRMFVFETGTLTNPRYIINFPTKRHWRGRSRIEDIDAGLVDLVRVVRDLEIKSIALPPLGSGLGGLDWRVVKERIVAALEPLTEAQTTVYEPISAPERVARATRVPEMTAGRAALVGLMRRYLSSLLDPWITLLEVHKLMYFLQEAGEPVRLRYVKAPYGPYAENLAHVLRAIEGHFISGYEGAGDRPAQELSLIPGAVEDAESFLRSHAATKERFDRVSQLVAGFETSFGLELLATTHWLLQYDGIANNELLVERMHEWGPAKAQFTREQVLLAAERLRHGGWVAMPAMA